MAGAPFVAAASAGSGRDDVGGVVNVAGVLVEAEQHGDEHAEQHRDVLEAHERSEAEHASRQRGESR